MLLLIVLDISIRGDLLQDMCSPLEVVGDQFFCIYIKFLLLLPKDYYLIPSKGTKNLFRPNRTCMLIKKNGFVSEFNEDLVWS